MQKSSIYALLVKHMGNKSKWRSIRIPEVMYQSIKKVIVFTGHVSVPEYIREKVNDKLTVDLLKVNNWKEKLEE